MRVFVSHSSKDKSFVRKLVSDIKGAGISIWFDEAELKVGDSLSAIPPAIHGSDCLIVVISAAASKSSWVEKEMEWTKEAGGIRILPVLLEDIPGEWGGELVQRAIADFRTPVDYRRSLQRLINAIRGTPNQEVSFPSAKEAAVKVKIEMNPSGDLFGLSQQGVATLYSLTQPRDWVFADATSGTSRLWIVEFYDPDKVCIQAYAVIDDSIHELPVLFLLDSDPLPVEDSVIIYSCALNHLFGISEQEDPGLIERNEAGFRHIAKRYTRFQPVPIAPGYIDSEAAVSRAIECGRETGVLRGANFDLFVLTKLECDKRYGGFLTWNVSFFDPTLVESVLTVGVDAVTGGIKHPAMRNEILNTDFFHIKPTLENGQLVMSVGNQFRAMRNRVWDIQLPGEEATTGLTAGEAIELAGELLGSDPERQWQLAFLSNTGVVNSAVCPHISSPQEGLMKADGTAGQWVVEVYSGEPRAVSDGERKGYVYDYKQILVTRKEGAVAVESVEACGFAVPLSRCPLPHRLLDAYENARALAIRCATVDFLVMSVSLARREGGAEWCFRFYDSKDLLLALRISGDGMRMIA